MVSQWQTPPNLYRFNACLYYSSSRYSQQNGDKLLVLKLNSIPFPTYAAHINIKHDMFANHRFGFWKVIQIA